VDRATEPAFWHGFLHNRRALIDTVLARIPELDMPLAERERMAVAMKAAQGRRAFVTPQLCVDYINAWTADRNVWRCYLAGLPRGSTARKALAHLGLTSTQIANSKSPVRRPKHDPPRSSADQTTVGS
jgi:hypothetical protein